MIRYSIRTLKGQARAENRDCAGAHCDGVRGVFVVVDGTCKPGSEKLAPALVAHILSGYQVALDTGFSDSSHDQVESILKALLNDAHTALCCGPVTGSASYLIAVISKGALTIAYEGDCSAGVASATGPIAWFTPPHCVANWKWDRDHRELASDLGRHRITRSFKARRAPNPHFVTRSINASERLVFATDGFWADLCDADQALMLDAEQPLAASVDDDVTWIVVEV